MSEVKILSTNDLAFFEKLGPTFGTRAQHLIDKGYKLKISFYSIRGSKNVNGQEQDVAMTGLDLGTTTVLKNNASEEQIILVRSQVDGFLKSLEADAGILPQTMIETPESALSEFEKHVNAPKPTPKKQKPPVSSGGKMALAQATAIGQKVGGTSPDSEYTCIAISEKVKVAARQMGNNISIRIEGAPSASDMLRFANFGIQQQSPKHWSTHFELNGVPVERVIGSLLFGLGIDFDQQILNAKELGKLL